MPVYGVDSVFDGAFVRRADQIKSQGGVGVPRRAVYVGACAGASWYGGRASLVGARRHLRAAAEPLGAATDSRNSGARREGDSLFGRRANASSRFRRVAERAAAAKSASFERLFADLSIGALHERAEARQLARIPKTFELYNNPRYRQTEGKGDACLERLRKSLDEFGFKRHTNQVHFHEEMLKACLRIIYRHDFEQNIDRVLKENNWDKMVQEVLIITARRIGKTTAVAIFAAALLMCVPHIELMIFSVSLNSSRKMLLMIQDFLAGHPVGRHMIVHPTNKDKLTLNGGANDRRTCESRPGRGQVRLFTAALANGSASLPRLGTSSCMSSSTSSPCAFSAGQPLCCCCCCFCYYYCCYSRTPTVCPQARVGNHTRRCTCAAQLWPARPTRAAKPTRRTRQLRTPPCMRRRRQRARLLATPARRHARPSPSLACQTWQCAARKTPASARTESQHTHGARERRNRSGNRRFRAAPPPPPPGRVAAAAAAACPPRDARARTRRCTPRG